jgi:hypothetical protein
MSSAINIFKKMKNKKSHIFEHITLTHITYHITKQRSNDDYSLKKHIGNLD